MCCGDRTATTVNRDRFQPLGSMSEKLCAFCLPLRCDVYVHECRRVWSRLERQRDGERVNREDEKSVGRVIGAALGTFLICGAIWVLVISAWNFIWAFA